MTPSGQLKMPRLGNYCLTVVGDGAADADVAQGADVAATSSNAQHAVEHIAGRSLRIRPLAQILAHEKAPRLTQMASCEWFY